MIQDDCRPFSSDALDLITLHQTYEKEPLSPAYILDLVQYGGPFNGPFCPGDLRVTVAPASPPKPTPPQKTSRAPCVLRNLTNRSPGTKLQRARWRVMSQQDSSGYSLGPLPMNEVRPLLRQQDPSRAQQRQHPDEACTNPIPSILRVHVNPLAEHKATFAAEECGEAGDSPSSAQWDVSPLNEDQNKQDQNKGQNEGDKNRGQKQAHGTEQERYRQNARKWGIEEGWRMLVPKEVGYGLMREGDVVEVPACDEVDERPWMPASPRWIDGMNPGRQPDEPFAADMRIVFLQSLSELVQERHWDGCSTEMEDEVDHKRYEHLCRQWAMCP